ncbi:hypothetical protein [Streptomyces sp. NPDC050704]|uniref:hypothetical protein n=1 Tax=Streptomyces sp. NPDC050704 TaxID=3157219 RepID=UPI00343E8F1C
MPLFRRADWPRDHRDEVVAGALVGAVVIVLGYASGIGATPSSGSAQGAVPPASPPAATAPQSPMPTPAPTQDMPGGFAPAPQVPIGGGGLPVGWGGLPVGPGGVPVEGGGHDGHGGAGGGSDGESGGGHDGHGSSPTPTPTPAPSGSTGEEPPDGSCDDGDVRLVQPLLTGIAGLTGQVLDLAGGTEPEPTPTPEPGPSQASPSSPSAQSALCLGIATPSLLGATP